MNRIIRNLILLSAALLTFASEATAQPQIQTINDIEELAKLACRPTTSGKYDTYKVGERFPIYYFQVDSFDDMKAYLGRMFIWSDIKTPSLPGLGDGVLDRRDDYNRDGVLNGEDVEIAVATAWGPNVAAGVTYDTDHVAKVWNAYLSSRLNVKFGDEELAFLAELESLGLVAKDGKGGYKVVKPASIIMVQPVPIRDCTPVVQHELTHAVMMQEPRFRQSVTDIWKSLALKERKTIHGTMAGMGLNPDIFENLIEEFAAYAQETSDVGGPNPMTGKRLGISAATRKRLQESLRKAAKTFDPFTR